MKTKNLINSLVQNANDDYLDNDNILQFAKLLIKHQINNGVRNLIDIEELKKDEEYQEFVTGLEWL